MPLVFVHGIGNRPGPGYEARRRERDLLFGRFLLPAIGGQPGEDVTSPMWGTQGAVLRWNGASLPRAGDEALGTGDGDDDLDEVCVEAAATETFESEDRLLLAMAGRDLADAVDLMFSAVPSADADDPENEDLCAAAEQIVAYCRFRERLCPDPDAALRYPWLGSVHDDLDLLDTLWQESYGWTMAPDGTPIRSDLPAGAPALGTDRDRPPTILSRGIRALRRAFVGAPTAGLAATVRMTTAERSTRLIGDVFAYLAHRGDRDAPGPIPTLVGDAIAQAARRCGAGRPLVVVAHSMGGNIVYDVLTHFRPDITVDVLVTVGSQVGLFEELALFRQHDPEIPNAARRTVPAPPNIGSWINVVDRADILAYRAKPIFDGVQDFDYPSNALWAHGAYFRQPNFHWRLADRVRQALA